jgi:subtilisin family serine protease
VFAASTVAGDATAAVQAAGGHVVTSIPEIGVVQAAGPTTLLPALSSRSDVLAVSPTLNQTLAPVREADATLASINIPAAYYYNVYQWDIKQVTNGGASFGLGTGSHATVVGIIDTGVNSQHMDLRANILGGRNFVPDGPGGSLDPNDIEDRNGHGSHVAGAIAGNGLILGVGPDLGIRAYRVFGADGADHSPRSPQRRSRRRTITWTSSR